MPKFTSDQMIGVSVALMAFIIMMSMVITTHRTSMACIEAGGTPSHTVHTRCSN